LHLLGILQLSGCGTCWGLDADKDATGPAPANSAVARRLIQFLVCHIYFASAVTKLKSTWFVGGELLQFSLLDRGWGGTALGQLLATSSFALRGISLATVLFELLFPFLIWVPRCRSALLAGAVTFHLGIWVTMNVGLFSPTMLVLLLAFLEPDRMDQIASRWFRESTVLPLSRWRTWCRNAGMYFAVGMMITLAGVAIQWECDWYGVFGRRSLRPLPHVPAEVVNSMRMGRKPALEDSVHRVAWGTWRGERDVLGDTRRIAIGGTLHVLVQFSVPHPAVRLEGVLIAPDGRLAARFEHQIDTSHSYAINGFELTREVPTGTARVILQLDGYEFAARSVEIFEP
ncbi:MAG: HTTM domain-containing protein, partial [Planctomycetota bacterium]|nr:HTTM domain-containing protein [Planctomycetota bacterium]